MVRARRRAPAHALHSIKGQLAMAGMLSSSIYRFVGNFLISPQHKTVRQIIIRILRAHVRRKACAVERCALLCSLPCCPAVLLLLKLKCRIFCLVCHFHCFQTVLLHRLVRLMARCDTQPQHTAQRSTAQLHCELGLLLPELC